MFNLEYFTFPSSIVWIGIKSQPLHLSWFITKTCYICSLPWERIPFLVVKKTCLKEYWTSILFGTYWMFLMLHLNFHRFVRRGFKECSMESLPAERRKRIDLSRGSKYYIKRLQPAEIGHMAANNFAMKWFVEANNIAIELLHMRFIYIITSAAVVHCRVVYGIKSSEKSITKTFLE